MCKGAKKLQAADGGLFKTKIERKVLVLSGNCE